MAPTSQESKSQNQPTSTQKPKQSSQQKPKKNTGGSSRDQKRKRWAKKAKPTPRPVKVAVLEYISKCCNVPARKPLAGAKEIIKDADTGKFIDKPKGLGHWRCQGCGKPCKVIPRKPQPKTVPEVSTVVPNVSTQEVPSDTGQSQ